MVRWLLVGGNDNGQALARPRLAEKDMKADVKLIKEALKSGRSLST